MKKFAFLLSAAILAHLACNQAAPATEPETAQETTAAPGAAMLSDEEKAEGFRLLFDGTTLNGWHSYLRDTVAGWQAVDGVITCPGKTGADLVSNETFENFDLRFEWKINPKGNSGVIYKVIEDPANEQPYISGPEYQVIDDAGYPAELKDVQKSGGNYDINAPSSLKANAPGEWNQGRILVNGSHVEHWLNGEKVAEYEYGTDEWKKNVAASKFKDWAYATPHAAGKIAFQDHSDPVFYRNVRIKTL